MVERELPALVLLDIGLPGEDGFAIARWLREKSGKVCIIMVTAAAGEIARINSIAAGAADFLTKPFSPQELVRRVGRVLDSVKVERSGEPREA